ncbi:hypothetical protein Mapa_014045 [Marchantia paleacea]|nr:hypothetical protein Mapa_014045 [Marchantia paleacea]
MSPLDFLLLRWWCVGKHSRLRKRCIRFLPLPLLLDAVCFPIPFSSFTFVTQTRDGFIRGIQITACGTCPGRLMILLCVFIHIISGISLLFVRLINTVIRPQSLLLSAFLA